MTNMPHAARWRASQAYPSELWSSSSWYHIPWATSTRGRAPDPPVGAYSRPRSGLRYPPSMVPFGAVERGTSTEP